jgi:hypothetical protein
MITNNQIIRIIRSSAQTLVVPMPMMSAGVDSTAPASSEDLHRYADAIRNYAAAIPAEPEKWTVDLVGRTEACANVIARIRDYFHAATLIRQAAEALE